MSGVVMEDKMTGDRFITHVTTMEDTMGGKMSEPEQMDSQSATSGKEAVQKIFGLFSVGLLIHFKKNK